MEPVIVEGAVRTIETVTNRVESSKTIVQRTTNTNSVHVNRYDAQGNLKSSDVDTESWEDRDTKTYEWSNPADRPATPPPSSEVALVGGADGTGVIEGELSVEKLMATEQTPETGTTVVMTTTDHVPGVSWSGTTVELRQSNVVPAVSSDAAGDVQSNQRTTTNMSGESWSRSGEVVWITESTPKPRPSTPGSAPQTLPAVENGVPVGVLVDVSCPPSTTSPGVSPPIAINGQLRPVVVSAGPPPSRGTPPVATPAAVEQSPSLSMEERRRRRCVENRARKAAADTAGLGDGSNVGVLQSTA